MRTEIKKIVQLKDTPITRKSFIITLLSFFGFYLLHNFLPKKTYESTTNSYGNHTYGR